MLKKIYHQLFSPKLDLAQTNLDKSIIKKYNLTRGLKKTNSFCHAPSTNMLFNQDGQVYACCHNKKISLGQYPQQSIKEIWNSAAANKYRQQMKFYNIPSACQVCISDFNQQAFHEMKSHHFDSLPIHSQYPVMMEFLLSNRCNLECIMCNGESSSLIRKNREKRAPIPYVYNDDFLNQLNEFIPYLKEVRFSSSGEAFSIDIYLDIWEKIITLNPSCLIVIQTNGTILTDRIKNILEKGNFQIGVSLDSLKKDVFESIRINANFEKVVKNIEYFRNYSISKKKKFDLSMCVMRNNWNEVADFIRYCNNNQAIANLHKVWHPIHLSLYNLPKSELERIYEVLKDEYLPQNTPLEKHNFLHYQYYIQTIHQWSKSALEEDIVLDYKNSYEHIEGFNKCLSKIQHYIYQQKDFVDKELEFEMFKNKFFTFFTLLNDINMQKAIIQHSEERNLDEFYEYIRYQNSEFLSDHFKSYYKNLHS